MPPALTTTIPERLEANSIPVPECGCHIWTAGLFSVGYGCIMIRRKSYLAHRIAWEQVHGPIPEGMCVLHRCDTRPCINVDHLFLGTKMDNVIDMDNKGRRKSARGTAIGAAKLTEEDVKLIRADGRTHRAIAADFGIAHSGVTRIKNRKLWTHL